MAMGQRGRNDAERALRNHAQFKNSTGSFCATLGSARELGWLRNHPQADRIRGLLRDAAYVVWSYGTPIGWVAEDEDGSFERFYVDVSHTTTTSAHQDDLMDEVRFSLAPREQGFMSQRERGAYRHPAHP